MRKTAMTLAALAIGGLMSTTVSAAPLSPVASAGVKQGLANSNVEQVHKNRRGWKHHRHWKNPADTATTAIVIPTTGGWYRYNYRPL
jgi:hypothetical protein